MRVLIVTFVRAYNYGAVLQCYALSKTLRDMGMDVQVLDYYPEYFRSQYNLAWLGQLRIFPNIHIRSWWKNLPLAMKLKHRNCGFERFINRYIPLTDEQYKTNEELDTAKMDFEIYISGSDQVWSNQCIPFDPVYYLTFPSTHGKKRCSYAASFGFTSISDDMKSIYHKYLDGWDLYSVREASAVKILERLIGVKPVQCCDPTLLLNSQQWSRVSKKSKHRKPYILIYTVSAAQELLDAARELAEVKKIDVLYLPCVMQENYLLGKEAHKYGFESLADASPDEWLGLFAKADYILTDSFHGTVFSLINHKRFMVVTSHQWGKNARAQELLHKLDVCGRNLPGNVFDIDRPINWGDVDQKLEGIRTESKIYLSRILALGEK